MNASTKTDPFCIRACRPEEAAALLELWRASGTAPSVTDTIADIRKCIESPAAVLVAVVGQGIVGSLIATFDGWRANMYRIAVHPDYRGQGIGRALVREGEARLKKQGAKRITALVEAKNPAGAAFWSRLGYAVEPEIIRFYRNPDVKHNHDI